MIFKRTKVKITDNFLSKRKLNGDKSRASWFLNGNIYLKWEYGIMRLESFWTEKWCDLWHSFKNRNFKVNN